MVMTIILEGGGGALCLVMAGAQFMPPVKPGNVFAAAFIGAHGLGLLFLAFGRMMGWPV
jgi:hypothetical protein